MQVGSVSLGPPHDDSSTFFWVDAKRELLEFEPLMEKPPNPKKHAKVKMKQVFKGGLQVFLNYPHHWSLSKNLRECEFYPFKVVKNLSSGLVEIYNVEQGSFKLDPRYLKSGCGHVGFSRGLIDLD